MPFQLNLQLPKFTDSTAWTAAIVGFLGVLLGAVWVSKQIGRAHV